MGLTSNYRSGQPVNNKCVSLSNTSFINRPISSIGVASCDRITPDNPVTTLHHGKAPLIDSFTAEDITITFDDWLLILERAATWNGWTPDETFMQLAGHLRGRATQEWKLLLPENRASNQVAVKALREKLDSGNQTLEALDFRHTSQQSSESVSDFITRLEKVFQTGLDMNTFPLKLARCCYMDNCRKVFCIHSHLSLGLRIIKNSVWQLKEEREDFLSLRKSNST